VCFLFQKHNLQKVKQVFLIFDYAITPRNGYQLLQKTNLIIKLSDTGNETIFPKQASTDNVIF